MINRRFGVALLALLTSLGLMTVPAQAAPNPAPAPTATPNLSAHPRKAVKAPKGIPPAPGSKSARALTPCLPNPPAQCYEYAEQAQALAAGDEAQGATVNLSIHKTFRRTGDYHTLTELAVRTGNNIIEVGYNIDPVVNGDSDPHLFVFYWVNGVGQGYNGGGFVDASGCSPCAGDSLIGAVGTTKSFAIEHIGTAWWVRYNGGYVGAFDDSLWTSPALSSVNGIQIFAEGVSSIVETCTDLASGAMAGAGASGSASAYALYGSTGTPSLSTGTVTDSTKWGVVPISSTSFRLGGPGWDSIGRATGVQGSCAPAAEGIPAASSLQLWRQICPDGAANTGCDSTYSYVTTSATVGVCIPLPTSAYDAVRAWNNSGVSGRTWKLTAQSNCNGATSLTLGNGGKGALTFEAHGIIRTA